MLCQEARHASDHCNACFPHLPLLHMVGAMCSGLSTQSVSACVISFFKVACLLLAGLCSPPQSAGYKYVLSLVPLIVPHAKTA